MTNSDKPTAGCSGGDVDEYQPRTQERLIEILRSQDQNPRSWQQEAAAALSTPSRIDHDAGIREALELARKRIEYFGSITDDRHREANEAYFLPPIDRAITALASNPLAGRGAK